MIIWLFLKIVWGALLVNYYFKLLLKDFFSYNVLGRSGCNIKQMCKISGCKIVLSREQVFSANNIPSHKVSLSGSIEQILHAKVLRISLTLIYFVLIYFNDKELISEKVKEEESFKKRKQEESLKRNSRSVPFSRSYPDGFSNSSGEGLQPTGILKI